MTVAEVLKLIPNNLPLAENIRIGSQFIRPIGIGMENGKAVILCEKVKEVKANPKGGK